jgi:hypothetical protein
MSANSSPAEVFRKLARNVAESAGSPWAFISTLAIVFVWVCSGPYFRFSDTWQLVINTGSSIVTFLMVFLIQNTQNRDTREIHLKLDELILVNSKARNDFMESRPVLGRRSCGNGTSSYRRPQEALSCRRNERRRVRAHNT